MSPDTSTQTKKPSNISRSVRAAETGLGRPVAVGAVGVEEDELARGMSGPVGAAMAIPSLVTSITRGLSLLFYRYQIAFSALCFCFIHAGTKVSQTRCAGGTAPPLTGPTDRLSDCRRLPVPVSLLSLRLRQLSSWIQSVV